LVEPLACCVRVGLQHYQSVYLFVMSAHSEILAGTGLDMNMASPIRNDDEESRSTRRLRMFGAS
jgi:hypothetical protein